MGGSPTELAPAIEKVAEIKKGVVNFYTFGPATYPAVKAGDIWIYPEIAAVVQQFADSGGPLAISVPKEGGPLGMNVAVVPAGARSAGCSKAFVGWLLGPEVQLAYAKNRYYQTVNTSLKLPAEVADKVFPKNPASIFSVDWGSIADHAPDILALWNRRVLG